MVSPVRDKKAPGQILGAFFTGLVFAFTGTASVACETTPSGQLVYATTSQSGQAFGQVFHAQQGSAPPCLDGNFQIVDRSAIDASGAAMVLRINANLLRAERPRLSFWSDPTRMQEFFSNAATTDSAPVLTDVADASTSKDALFPVIAIGRAKIGPRTVKVAKVLLPISREALGALKAFNQATNTAKFPLAILDLSGSARPFVAGFMRDFNRALTTTSVLDHPLDLVIIGGPDQIARQENTTLSGMMVADANLPKFVAGDLTSILANETLPQGLLVVAGGDISLPESLPTIGNAIVAKLTPEVDGQLLQSAENLAYSFVDFSATQGQLVSTMAQEIGLFSGAAGRGSLALQQAISAQQNSGFLAVTPTDATSFAVFDTLNPDAAWQALPFWVVVNTLLFKTEPQFPQPLFSR